MKRVTERAAQEALRSRSSQLTRRAGLSATRIINSSNRDETTKHDNNIHYPRKIFSGIQPTGSLHLGNYLGAVQRWTQLQNAREDVTYCIVDMHSITLPQDPAKLRKNIFQMAATVLACGVDPEQSTIFVQSAVKEHSELCWVLSCLTTMARLAHLPQYKEKTRLLKDIPLGLFVYPVLQAADILAYRTTHVPVGEDQVQHIQLAQHLAKTFNTRFGSTFPIPHAVIDNTDAKRIRSLRDPTKKMSKSDPDLKATINLLDSADQITEKIKKAVTDFTSDVTYNPEKRMGVSNLVVIHSLVTGKSIPQVVEEAKTIDTARFKMRVSEAVIEHLRPMRLKVEHHMDHLNDLAFVLNVGAQKARQVAKETMAIVQQKVGLGAINVPIITEEKEEQVETKADVKDVDKSDFTANAGGKPVVPKQKLRIEKQMQMKIDIHQKIPPFIIEKPCADLKPITKPHPESTADSNPEAKAEYEVKTAALPSQTEPEKTTDKHVKEAEV